MRKIFFAITLAVVATACHTNDSATLKEGQIIINASTRSDVGSDDTSKIVLDDTLVPATNAEATYTVKQTRNTTAQTNCKALLLVAKRLERY